MSSRTAVRLLVSCSFLGLMAGAAVAQEAPIVQPGAPGQAARTITAEEAARIADNRYSADDVAFMQGMIQHHAQAVEMAALVEGRTNRQELIEIAGRIDASQGDEIAFMQGWLRERGEDAPDPAAMSGHAGHQGMDHGAHAGHGGGHAMPGMATPAQMAELATLTGPAFDRMFLDLMIAHHEGAVEMVSDLFGRPGSAYDPVLYDFANDITNEQEAEINRMTAIRRELSDDPRSTLAAGFRDAGEAASNLRLVHTLPKPVGFYDANNPAGLPPAIPAETEGEDARGPEAEARFGQRGPFLSFANTDIAFSGDLMAVGNYHGFNLYRLSDGQAPRLISSVVCPGGQGDVSIVGDLLIMSVEQNTGRVDCGRQGVAERVSAERFRGLRIFDISNPVAPAQVGQVQTCRGSHTHSVVSADERSIVVYNSGTAGVRDEEELPGCVGALLGDDRTALFSIDVIEIPVANPAAARIVDSPRVFADDETGRIAGLWQGGDHGEGTQTTSRTDQCHDITVFPSANLAAGACSGNGILLDISNPRAPRRIDAVNDPGFAYWHSATFNNDGTKVIFTDEWGGGGRPRCRVQDPMTWGADAIYDIENGRLERRGYYKIPAAQSDKENCVAHNGSIVPVPGRDIFAQAWYQGGLSVVDFTDSANPTEIAYFDRGPIDAEHAILGGYWSTYWYDGRIYGTEIVRGLDVIELTPSEHLTANEIAAAEMADQGGTFNPQQQFPVRWPDHPVVARAYVDQLARSGVMAEGQARALNAALEQAEAALDAGRTDAALAEGLANAARASAATSPADRSREAALNGLLTRLSARLR
ncbi:DUF305 domain-containing protein [Brevundimonas balnearis]|uniref:DUF305 domain-containing protein n=1 Tax=Brevundimonas balnearis TaxID=1572858 RepID=A0ABV6R5C2_9CAUL